MSSVEGFRAMVGRAFAVGLCLVAVGCADDDGVGEAARVVVADQVADPANRVLIDEVVLDRGGWVVVRADHIGIPADVIGFAPVLQGTSSAVEVTLARSAVDGEVLYAELRYDEGEVDVFEADEDPPARDSRGRVIAPGFTVSVERGAQLAEVIADDQALDWPFEEVVVRRATVQVDAAWLLLREDANGQPGSLLGRARLGRGANTQLLVTLARAANDGELIWAELAVDADPVGTYNPVGDVAITRPDGAPVRTTFTVDAARTSSALEVDDLTKSGDLQRVRIRRVASEGPGWLVVREANGSGAVGPRIGRVHLGDGARENVDVDIGRRVRDGERLWAELHRDAGEIEVFEPDGPDASVLGPTPFDITLDLEPTIEVADQDVDLTLRLFVDEVRTSHGGWLVAQADEDDAPGAVLGAARIDAGIVADRWVELDTPLVDGQRVWLTTWEEGANAGSFSVDDDLPYLTEDDAPAAERAVMTVPAGTADVGLVLDNEGQAYTWSAVPSWIVGEAVGAGATNNAITLRAGWRYEIRNLAAETHPFAFVTDGGGPDDDAVQLSQTAEGALEGDPDVTWQERDDDVRFTVTEAFMAAVDGYRCEAHSAVMRGAVRFVVEEAPPAP